MWKRRVHVYLEHDGSENSVSHKNTKEGNEANKNTNTGMRSIEGGLQRQIRQTPKWNCFRRVFNGNIKNGLNHPLLFVTKNCSHARLNDSNYNFSFFRESFKNT